MSNMLVGNYLLIYDVDGLTESLVAQNIGLTYRKINEFIDVLFDGRTFNL